MDDKWRAMTCPICRGYGMRWVGDASWDGTAECDNCGESGTVYLRPNGSSFQYPGGPATGMWGKQYYEKAKPYLPACEHGVIFVNNVSCVKCDEDFIKDFGYSWEEELRTERNLRRRERYAQKKRQQEIKSTVQDNVPVLR